MSVDIQDLQAQRLEITQTAQTLMDKIYAEERDPTDVEEGELEAYTNKLDALDRQIARRVKLAAHQDAATTSAGTIAAKAPTVKTTGPTIFVPKDLGKWKFANFGEYLVTAIRGSARGAQVDQRLFANAPTTYSQESSGPDGGFAVPPDFRQEIAEKVMGEDSFAGRCDVWNTTSNTLTIPYDETTPWQTTGGVQVYWESEGGQLTQSKLSLQERTLRLVPLRAYVILTNELLEDAPSLQQYALRKVPAKMDYKLKDAIINGTGVGQPLGIRNAPCTISVAKESGQAADTVVFQNISNMYSRLYSECRSNAVWIINQDLEPQLDVLAFPQPAGSTSSFPAYLPPGGFSASPYASLKGKPVLPTEAAQTVGTQGDIILGDFSQYLLATKGSAPRTDLSMHIFFDYDMTALRIVFRVMGMPWWGAPITRANGTNTLSSFVQLDERA